MGSIPMAGTSTCSPGYYINTDSGTYYSPGSCTPAFSTYNQYPSSMSAPTLFRGTVNADSNTTRQEYLRNLMRAIYRDQELLDKATTLAALYQEMKTVQNHYQKIKAEDDARKEEARQLRREQRDLHRAPAQPNKGPRS
jgi:hypothetical protein